LNWYIFKPCIEWWVLVGVPLSRALYLCLFMYIYDRMASLSLSITKQMTSLEQLEQVEFLNLQYLDNTELIQRLQDKLLLDIIQFNLCEKDLYQTKEYIKDKGNMTAGKKKPAIL
jgi:hypothetical protein